MERLPNYQKAYIDIDKLKEYCLNEYHPIGKHKALIFKAALGISSENAEDLKAQILKNLAKSDISEGENDNFGMRYIVNIKIKINNKEAIIKTAWIIRKNENYPHLLTCFVIQ